MAKRPPPKKPRPDGTGVIYARYSSHNQKDASIEQQVAECTAYADSVGLKITQVYADRAVSGRTDQRPNFQRLLRDAEKGKFDYIVAWKSNRIGRNMLQAMVNEERFSTCGVRVLYAEEDFDDTAAGRFALRSMMNVNQFYSENMAEDVKRGMMDNAIQAKSNGPLPFGYKAAGDLSWVVDEPKDEIVREIYTRVAAGEALVDIANSLNARGITTKQGKPWGRSSFNVLLSNERYRGIYIFGDVRIEGAIPRIVSDDLFYQVQEALKVKKNPRGQSRSAGTYLLTGKLYCGHCKAPMIGLTGTSKTGDLHYYYVCQNHRAHSCEKKNVRRDETEDMVARAIMDYCLRDDIIELIADKTVAYNNRRQAEAGVALLEAELAEAQTATKNVLKAIEQGIVTDTTKARLLELESKQADLRGKIAAARADIVEIDKDELITGLKLFRNGDIKDKKFQARLFDTFLVAVYLYDDSFKLVFSFTGNKNSIDLPLGDLIDSPPDDDFCEKVRLDASQGYHKSRPFFIKTGGFCIFSELRYY
ncbi:MAG: recombinase family protein [Oscillospiraceae bacterium]|nr:recombinase family protein [Oscillospiraceae bacterium]